MSIGYSKQLPLSSDGTMSGNSAFVATSQSAVVTYVGSKITGTTITTSFSGGTIPNGTSFTSGLSANTLYLTTAPTYNPSDTQVLTYNSTTGLIDAAPLTGITSSFNYGLVNAIATMNFLT